MKDKKKEGEGFRRFTWRMIKIFGIPVVKRKFGAEIEPVGIEPPYLIIPNHAMNLDPVLIGMASVDTPMAFVSSEHLERLGLLSKIMSKCFTLIPRSKAASGLGAVRGILRVLRENKPVVLFAEGDCTWDGVSQRIFPATGKLAKAVKVPLVIYRLKGNYLSKPRWAEKARSGSIKGEIARVIMPEELEKMGAEEVEAAINEGIFVDIAAEQEASPVSYKCRAKAEGLERALFICPECGEIGGLKTKGDTILCACGAKSVMDDRGFLSGGRFRTVREWELWQEERLGKLLEENTPGLGRLFEGRGEFTRLPEGKKEKVAFSLDLTGGAMNVGGERFPLRSVSDIAMVKTDRLLFTAEDKYYELHSKRGILRPYLMAAKLSQTRS